VRTISVSDSRLYPLRWLLGALLLAAVSWQSGMCQPAAPGLDDFLAAGEFGPALRMARANPDPQQRDQWLGRIARAQSRAGARAAAASTLSSIDSDVIRTESIGSMIGSDGAAGGAAMADFDTLIELITSTIAPDSWDLVGGAGAIEAFPTGVYVDTSGLMKRLQPVSDATDLPTVWQQARNSLGRQSVCQSSPLRKVSLPRLEKQLQLRHALSVQPNAAMRYMAGIYRVEYLLVYPETGDVVLAGPAGDWETNGEGRVVNVDTGIPVLQLDDLAVALRNAFGPGRGRFGCAIKPTDEGLANVRQFVDQWQGKSVRRPQRKAWLEELRCTLGRQKIEFWGIDPTTNAARVIVEADHHMKLIGMGLTEGTLGVTSYLDAARQARGSSQPNMSVLRWWFALNYHQLKRTPDGHAFAWTGPGVRVLSENELLRATGERVHTGKSEDLNRQFAHSFTTHFEQLANKYPLYAELRNLFDLALVAAILRSEDLPEQIHWHLLHLLDDDAYQVATFAAPAWVESVVNCCEINRRQFIAGVSGGVSVDTRQLLEDKPLQIDRYGKMEAAQKNEAPGADMLGADAWWWD
jgi:hypothetical protein